MIAVTPTLHDLAETYALSAADLAALLRPHGSDYPSPGLVRTMLAGYQRPSARFAALVEARQQELAAQLEPGIAVLHLGGKIRRLLSVDAKRHVTMLLKLSEAEADVAKVIETLEAHAAIRPGTLRRCTICHNLFVASNVRQEVCRRQNEKGAYPCVSERDRRVRSHKRKMNQRKALKGA